MMMMVVVVVKTTSDTVHLSVLTDEQFRELAAAFLGVNVQSIHRGAPCGGERRHR